MLPTVQDKWVSLHPSFGLVCWCDDRKLKKKFKHLDGIDFIYFGELSKDDKEMVKTKVSVLMKTLGIPTLSEVRYFCLLLSLLSLSPFKTGYCSTESYNTLHFFNQCLTLIHVLSIRGSGFLVSAHAHTHAKLHCQHYSRGIGADVGWNLEGMC